MSSVIISGDTSGSITLSAPAVSGTNTITLPAASGVVSVSGNMPAFSAYANANQTITTATFTKIQVNTEEFDTNNCYDPTTNYRFTPTVAGYYQLNGQTTSNSGAAGTIAIYVYKNGSNWKKGTENVLNAANANSIAVSCIAYFNGSTDYAELYCYQNSGSNLLIFTAGAYTTYFQAAMVRGA